jgi:hypothetical protein
VYHDRGYYEHGHHEYHGGHDFRGRYDHRWERRSWDGRYGCYLYWYPAGRAWHYWCAPDACYYPVDYCPYGVYAW